MGVLSAINSSVLGRNTWPPPAMRDRWADIDLLIALRESHDTRLRQEASVRYDQPYIHTPLARMVSRASANLLFGQPARITPGVEADQTVLDDIVTHNSLESELHRAAIIASSEGEVWGRIVVDPSLLDYPIIEWVSPLRVIPHFHGRFILGATFVSEWKTGTVEVHRLLETYEAGAISARLYRGTGSALGTQVDLASLPQTAGRADVVPTGIDQPLVAFVPNSIGADPTRGFSDYRGLEQRFLALNETVTVGQQNLKLAGRKRALVDAEYLDRRGRFIDGDDVYVRHQRDEMLGESSKPVSVLDYSYDSSAIVAWIDHLIDSTVTLAGISPAQLGRSLDGGAISGTALRLKMSHSLMEAAGKGRYFDRGVQRLLGMAAVIDSRPTTEGGFGRRWSDPSATISVERQDGMIRDDLQAAQVLSAIVGAGLSSTDQAIADWHPDWSPDQVQQEMDRISGEMPATPTISTPVPPITPA